MLQIKKSIQSSQLTELFPQNYGNIEELKKLAAVSRETPDNRRNSQSQNTLDPGMAEEYFAQISEEIEGRATEKLSKEFSRTESRILGALSKLDEFLLNPQIRTCSVAVSGTSRINDSENREPTGDCSLGNLCPETMFSTYHSTNLNDSEQEETHHKPIRIISVKSGSACMLHCLLRKPNCSSYRRIFFAK